MITMITMIGSSMVELAPCSHHVGRLASEGGGGAPAWLIPPALLVDDRLARLYLALLAIGAAIAVISLATQMRAPTPYGRHAVPGAGWGPPIPERLSRFLSTALPCVLLFVWLFFASRRALAVDVSLATWTLLALWLAHFGLRGFLHPWVTRFSQARAPLGLCLGRLIPNAIFATLNGLALAAMCYPASWTREPTFALGLSLFVVGWIVNRHADGQLRALRNRGGQGYALPRGGLFRWVSCPNYLGELVMWCGWGVATWSAAGATWALFAAATFIPRARDHHRWYQERFPDYPPERRALVPFLW